MGVVVVGVVLAVDAGGGGPGSRPAGSRVADASRRSTTRPPTTTLPPTTTAPPTTTTLAPPPTTDPGALPQTDEFPSTDTPQFEAEMSALWQGVVSGSEQAALGAFFPRSAYLQVKTVADPGSDYDERLVSDYGADVAAAHALLGPDADAATLTGVSVPAQYGHWIPPGVCDNAVGYFEVADSRVVYQLDGQTRSFGIASMISWRGQWYVVHLGAILRSSNGGEVDDPEVGPGSSADSTTC